MKESLLYIKITLNWNAERHSYDTITYPKIPKKSCRELMAKHRTTRRVSCIGLFTVKFWLKRTHQNENVYQISRLHLQCFQTFQISTTILSKVLQCLFLICFFFGCMYTESIISWPGSGTYTAKKWRVQFFFQLMVELVMIHYERIWFCVIQDLLVAHKIRRVYVLILKAVRHLTVWMRKI